jgi:hypothetical protein
MFIMGHDLWQVFEIETQLPYEMNIFGNLLSIWLHLSKRYREVVR